MIPKYRIKETTIESYKLNSSVNFEKYNKPVFQVQKFNFWFLSYELVDYNNYSTYEEALNALFNYIRLSQAKKKTKYHYFGYMEFKFKAK